MHFVDTNVLVYARDDAEPGKRDRARSIMALLWNEGNGRLSQQVLVEFYATVTRKLRPGLAKGEAMADVRELSAWNPIPPSLRLYDQAWQIEEQHGLSWWDSLIVAAALAQDCITLLTEDLQDGLTIGKLRVINPFPQDFDLAMLGQRFPNAKADPS